MHDCVDKCIFFYVFLFRLFCVVLAKTDSVCGHAVSHRFQKYLLSASLLWMFSQPQLSPMFPFSVLLTARVLNRLIQRAQNKKASMKESFSIDTGSIMALLV